MHRRSVANWNEARERRRARGQAAGEKKEVPRLNLWPVLRFAPQMATVHRFLAVGSVGSTDLQGPSGRHCSKRALNGQQAAALFGALVALTARRQLLDPFIEASLGSRPEQRSLVGHWISTAGTDELDGLSMTCKGIAVRHPVEWIRPRIGWVSCLLDSSSVENPVTSHPPPSRTGAS